MWFPLQLQLWLELPPETRASAPEFTPEHSVFSASNTSLKAVVVFVQSENYEYGSGNAFDASVLSSTGDVIVVTLNFRLGLFGGHIKKMKSIYQTCSYTRCVITVFTTSGFLSSGDGRAQGNYALLDIVAALHYLRQNIRNFGGDPDSVTLMGHGHGASLVHLLTVSPVTAGTPLTRKTLTIAPIKCK